MIGLLPARFQALPGMVVPVATALLAAILDLLPLPDAGPAAIAPNLVLVAVFYWSLHQPRGMTPGIVFMVGIVRDLVADLPVGMTSLSLLVVPLLLRKAPLAALQRSAGVAWASFVLVTAVVGLVRWLLGTAYWDHALALRPFAVEMALTVVVYPVVAFLLGLTEPLLRGGVRAAGD